MNCKRQIFILCILQFANLKETSNHHFLFCVGTRKAEDKSNHMEDSVTIHQSFWLFAVHCYSLNGLATVVLELNIWPELSVLINQSETRRMATGQSESLESVSSVSPFDCSESRTGNYQPWGNGESPLCRLSVLKQKNKGEIKKTSWIFPRQRHHKTLIVFPPPKKIINQDRLHILLLCLSLSVCHDDQSYKLWHERWLWCVLTD